MAIDFQFDSTTDGKAVKVASMIDEHTRESLLDLVERSITGANLVEELKKVFTAAAGRRRCCGWTTAPELVSKALQRFCDG